MLRYKRRGKVYKLRAVIDTNVLVASLINPKGAPAQVVQGIFDDRYELYYSEPILSEYRAVLMRKRFNFDSELVYGLLDTIGQVGNMMVAEPSVIKLPDESDRKFYDLAILVEGFLVTGNIQHFPGIDIAVTPAAFLSKL